MERQKGARRRLPRILLSCGFALASGPAFAGESPVSGSAWVLDVSSSSSGLADSNPSAPEKKAFAFKVFNSGSQELCRAAASLLKIPASQSLSQTLGEGLGARENIGFSASRGVMRYPSGDLALADEADFGGGVELGETRGDLPVRGAGFGLVISMRGAIKGASLVVRPLHERDSCNGLKKELELQRYKTVLPLTAGRIRAMEVGELWKLSQDLQIGIGVSGGLPAALPGAAAGLTLGFSGSRQRTVAASLYRLDQKTLRYRLRLDRVRVRRTGGGADLAVFPALDLRTPVTEQVLAKFLPQILAKPAGSAAAGAAARAISGYLSASLHLSQATSAGDRLILEYLVDLDDPRQVDGLVAALKGNLEALKLLRSSISDAVRLGFTEKAADALLDREEVLDSGDLGLAPAYAGGESSRSKASGITLHLPLVLDFDGSSTRGSERIFSYDKAQGEYRSYTSEKNSDAEYAAIPIIGHYVSRRDQRELKAISYYDGSGRGLPPEAVYVRQYGFSRASAEDVRAQVAQFNGIMRYAGAAGHGSDPRLEVPLPDRGRRENRKYDKGSMAFTLVFGRKALQDVESASPGAILAAYGNAFPEAGKKAFSQAMRYVSVSPAGVAIDPAVYDLPDDSPYGVSTAGLIANMAQLLVRDVLRMRAAKTGDERARALRDLYDDKGRPGHHPGMILKVLVQLADPKDLAAEMTLNLVSHLDKDTVSDAFGREKKASSVKRYLFNPALFQNRGIEDFSRRQSRFAQPSRLED